MRENHWLIRRKARELENFIIRTVEESELEENVIFKFYNNNEFCFIVAKYSIEGEERSWSILSPEQKRLMPIEDLLSISEKLYKTFAPSIEVPSAEAAKYEKNDEDLNCLSIAAEVMLLEENEVIQTISSSSDNQCQVDVNDVTKEEIENWVTDDDVGEKLQIDMSEQSASNVEGACTLSHQFILEILLSMRQHYQKLQKLEVASHAFMAGITRLSKEDAAYFYNNIVKILNTLGK